MTIARATILGLADVVANNKTLISRYMITHGLFKSNINHKLKFTKGSNFFIKRLINNNMKDITIRKNHVKSESFNTIPENNKPRIGTLVVQHHKASHDHYDISIIDKNEEIFRGAVTKSKLSKLFPKTTKSSTSFIRQPQHEASYSLKTPDKFTIPEGEYGAGTVKRVLNIPVEIMKTDNNKVSFKVYEKGFEGHYSLQNREEYWQCIRKKEPVADRLGKAKFRLIGKDDNKIITPKIQKEIDKYIQGKEYVVEEKLDGANNYLKFSEKGNTIWSHRISKKSGGAIFHHDKYEHLRDEVFNNLDKTVVRGELVYSEGKVSRLRNMFFKSNGTQVPNITAGLSNTKNALVSRASRKAEGGKVSFVIWDIHKYKGKNIEDLPYSKKMEIIDKITKDSTNFFSPRRWKDPVEAWNKVVKEEGGEGIVIKRLDLPSPQPDAGVKNTWLKLKAHDFKDVKVVGWEPLRFSDTREIDDSRLGKFIVMDDEGRKFEVGSGIPAFERKWFRKNINQILEDESIIRVKYYSQSETSLQKPIYKNVHYEKSDGILCELALEKNADNLGVNKYQLKSSAGWRKNG